MTISISNEVLLEKLRNAGLTHSHIPGRRAKELTGFGLTTYSRHFGTWRKACQLAGLDTQQPARLKANPRTKICNWCATEFPTKVKAAKYCSRKCMGKALASHPSRKGKILKSPELRLARLRETYRIKQAAKSFESLGLEAKRKRIILEQKNCCNHCGLSEWCSQPLTLELEHKNGNNNDDRRENLECICPNCHSLTPTWRGRNKRKSLGIVELTNIRNAVLQGVSLSKAMKDQGLAGKGANHARIKAMLVPST